MKRCDLPFRWRVQYKNQKQCSLIALGEVLDSGNPNFAVEEKQVQNGIVRSLGMKKPTKFSPVLVERLDGTLWKIDLSNFRTFEIITELED